MKSWFLLIIMGVLFGMQISRLHAYVTGTVELVTGLDTNHLSRNYGCFYFDIANYQKGGVTFTYPENCFATAPYVFVTLVLTGYKYSETSFVIAEVVDSTATSATVRVNLTTLLPTPAILEASPDDVEVHIYAVGE